jgi:hypothetical protein
LEPGIFAADFKRVGGDVRYFVQAKSWSSRRLSVSGVAAFALLMASVAALHAESRKAEIKTQSIVARSDAPLIVLVSLRKQRLRIFDDKGEITSSRISTGQPGFDTPTGVFSILEKSEHHESNIYEGAEMPFMQRITWSGIALHAGVVPGYRASHGCIRLPYNFAKSIFPLTRQGNRVIVTNEEATPAVIEHANLFRPLPAEYKEQAAAPPPAPVEPKVAANDVAAPDGTHVPNFIGLTGALAAPMPAAPAAPSDTGSHPRSRAEADKMQADKIARLKTELTLAEDAKNAVADKVKAALRAARDAESKIAAARQAGASARATVTDAERKLASARSAFAAFMRAPNAKPDAPAAKRGTPDASLPGIDDREADFEDAILDATVERDRARKDAEDPERAIAEAEAAFKAADDARQAAITEVRDIQDRVRCAQIALNEATKDAARRNKPLSVLVSLKSERVYIRQGFEPVLEAPVAVDKTAGKVGTHVFTAMKYGKDPDSFEWHHVGAQGAAITRDDEDEDNSKKRKKVDNIRRESGAGAQQATAALNAFELPDDVLDFIMERARPGASLIVSDKALSSNENGPGTEFTLLTR